MKTVLVTGSTQGIGKALAEAYVQKGYRVIVHCSRDLEKAKRIGQEIGAHMAVTADLSNPEETLALAQKTGDVDILVCNASVQFRHDWEDIPLDEFDQQVNVNFKSTLILMQSYFPHMKAQGFGRIITIGSVQQYKPNKAMAIYAATKCAVMSLVHNIAKQVAKYGVTVNNVAPGVIATPRNDAALSDKDYAKEVMSWIPSESIGEPTDLTGAVLMLSGDEGRYITGTDIIVDGGMHLN